MKQTTTRSLTAPGWTLRVTAGVMQAACLIALSRLLDTFKGGGVHPEAKGRSLTGAKWLREEKSRRTVKIEMKFEACSDHD